MSYARKFSIWAGVGSNHRRPEPMDLQSIPFSHSGTYPLIWSRWRDSNPRPFDYKSNALSTELHRQKLALQKKSIKYSSGKTRESILFLSIKLFFYPFKDTLSTIPYFLASSADIKKSRSVSSTIFFTDWPVCSAKI